MEEEISTFLTEDQHKFLTNTLKLYEGQNYLVRTHYLRLILRRTETFYEHELDDLTNYLKTYGVSDFMDGIYRLFYKRDEKKAMEVYNSCTNFYHDLMKSMVESEIKDARENFPIFSLELKGDKCLLYNKTEQIQVYATNLDMAYNKSKLGNLEVQGGIYLVLDDNKIELNCTIGLEQNQSYCQPKEEIKVKGAYKLRISERIQKVDFAINPFESQFKYAVYFKEILIDKNTTQNSYEIDYAVNSTEMIEIKLLEESEDNLIVKNNDKEIPCLYQSNKKIWECEVNQEKLNYDTDNPKEFENYELKVYNRLCGNELYSISVKVKNSNKEAPHSGGSGGTGEPDNGGLSTLTITLICIGSVVVLILVLFFVIRAVRKKNNNNNNIDDVISDQGMLTDQ